MSNINIIWAIVFVLLVAAVITLAILYANKENSADDSKNTKSLFKGCATNFECPMGYLCELRDHPSKGICVIPPAGACYEVSEIDGVCYSGHYCDKQDGICLKI
jgi:hypothetical protein